MRTAEERTAALASLERAAVTFYEVPEGEPLFGNPGNMT